MLEKFGYNKKRAHLSSLIVGGEMSREQALKELEDTSSYTKEEMLQDRDYILDKLEISLDEWDKIMTSPNKSEDDYANSKRMLQFVVKAKRVLYTRKKGMK